MPNLLGSKVALGIGSIDGLKAEWGLDRSGVARRLIAAAALSLGLG